jgi:DNA-directed RNA polymerase specialized sigma24 family protein
LARDDEFADLVAARYRALVRTGLLLTGDAGHLEDLAQSALIRTYRAWPRLREPASAESYARKVLTLAGLPGRAAAVAGRDRRRPAARAACQSAG